MSTRSSLGALLLAVACAGTDSPPDACRAVADGGVAATAAGLLQGHAQGSVCAFLGVPYAPPPVGARRWEAPGEVARWPGVRHAPSFGPPCPQLAQDGSIVGSEDCLYLNVWAPGGTAKPVLVFFHGGGNAVGASSEPYYDGAELARHGDAVVVTADYRLGPLGYLALRSLDRGTAGNYGLSDQAAVLRWVQRNVSQFGGDPDHVLAFGQSAGARNLCTLVSSLGTRAPFRAAVLESGACEIVDTASALALGDQFVEDSGCSATGTDVTRCVRALDLETVLTLVPDPPTPLHTSLYNPNGTPGYQDPLSSEAPGYSAHVPLVVGVNAEEAGFVEQPVASEAAYALLLEASFGGAAAARILQEYPLADFRTPRDAWTAVVTDLRYVCPARTAATVFSAQAPEPVYRYLFTQRFSREPERSYGAFHGLEIPYLFRTFEAVGYDPTPDDVALSDVMIQYWLRLAEGGDPNGPGAPAWPAYDARTDPYLVLGTPVEARTGLRTAHCDFWRSL